MQFHLCLLQRFELQPLSHVLHLRGRRCTDAWATTMYVPVPSVPTFCSLCRDHPALILVGHAIVASTEPVLSAPLAFCPGPAYPASRHRLYERGRRTLTARAVSSLGLPAPLSSLQSRGGPFTPTGVAIFIAPVLQLRVHLLQRNLVLWLRVR